MIVRSIKSNFSSQTKMRVKRALGINPTLTLLKKIEHVEGKISYELKESCDQYAVDVLGSKVYAPWLYVYGLVSGQFKEGWIPDNYYGAIVIPRIKGAYGEASELNGLQCSFRAGTFPDIMYRINGLFIDKDRQVVSDQAVINRLFDSQDTVVFKLDQSKQGKGVRIIHKEDFQRFELSTLPNGVFQSFIYQHPDLAKFHPESVATLRLTTIVDDAGKVSLRAGYIRFGSGQDSHVKSASHVRVPINLRNGRYSEFGYSVEWLKTDRHPDTGEVFGGDSLPGFSACVDTVLEAHREMPFVRCIGWDVAIDSSRKPYILEWNGAHNDIKFSEATQGPCFSDLGWENLWHTQ